MATYSVPARVRALLAPYVLGAASAAGRSTSGIGRDDADASRRKRRTKAGGRTQRISGVFPAPVTVPSPGLVDVQARMADVVEYGVDSAAARVVAQTGGNQEVYARMAGTWTHAYAFHQQLLCTLSEAPQFAQRQCRTLTVALLRFMLDDYYGAANRRDLDAAELDIPAELTRMYKRLTKHMLKQASRRGLTKKQRKQQRKADASGAATVAATPSSDDPAFIDQIWIDGTPQCKVFGPHPAPLQGGYATQRLVDFLKVFKHFTNWNEVPGSAYLRDLFTRLLVKSDGGVAKEALECVLGFQDESLAPYRSHLLALVDDKTYRHEMTMFSVNRNAGVVADAHRPVLVPTLVRLLYGRLLQRKGKSSKDTPAARRAAVLSYFAGYAATCCGCCLCVCVRVHVCADHSRCNVQGGSERAVSAGAAGAATVRHGIHEGGLPDAAVGRYRHRRIHELPDDDRVAGHGFPQAAGRHDPHPGCEPPAVAAPVPGCRGAHSPAVIQVGADGTAAG